MNKTMTITVIVLVAVVMGMSAVAPAIPMAHAMSVCPPDTLKGTWLLLPKEVWFDGDRIDKNGNGKICVLHIVNNHVGLLATTIDDLPVRAV